MYLVPRRRLPVGAPDDGVVADVCEAELLGEGLGDEGLAGAAGADEADAPARRRSRGHGSPVVLVSRGEDLRLEDLHGDAVVAQVADPSLDHEELDVAVGGAKALAEGNDGLAAAGAVAQVPRRLLFEDEGNLAAPEGAAAALGPDD